MHVRIYACMLACMHVDAYLSVHSCILTYFYSYAFGVLLQHGFTLGLPILQTTERLRAESSGLALCNRGALGLRIGFLYKDYNRSFKRASIRVTTVPLNVLL